MNKSCKNCSQINVIEARFCKQCGMSLLETEDAAAEHAAAFEMPTLASSKELYVMEPKSEQHVIMATTPSESLFEKTKWVSSVRGFLGKTTPKLPLLSFLTRKPGIYGLVGAVVLIIAVCAVWIGGFSGNPSSGQRSIEKYPLLYTVDKTLYGVEKKPGKVKLTDTLTKSASVGSSDSLPSSLMQVSGDGSVACYIENYDSSKIMGDLFCKPQGRDKIRIAVDIYAGTHSGFLSYQLSRSGLSVSYLANFDDKTLTGELYSFDLKSKKSEKISASAGQYFKVSPDGKSVFYLDSLTGEKDAEKKGELYVKSLGKGKVKVDSDVIYPISISDKGRYAIYLKSQDSADGPMLYFKQENKVAEKLTGSSIHKLMINRDRDQFLIEANYDSKTDASDLYYIAAGKDKEKISTQVKQVYFPQSLLDSYDFSTEEGILYLDAKDIGSMYYYGKAKDDDHTKVDVYVSLNGSQEKIASDIDQSVGIGNNGRTVAFIGNYDTSTNSGDLYVSRIVKGKPTDKEKIADKVSSFQISPEVDRIYYMKDYKNGKGDVYALNDKNVSEKEITDASPDFKISKDGKTALFLTDYSNDKGELYLKEYGKDKKLKLASDVHEFYTYDYKRIYVMRDWSGKNEKGDLYTVDSSGKTVKLDSDVGHVYEF